MLLHVFITEFTVCVLACRTIGYAYCTPHFKDQILLHVYSSGYELRSYRLLTAVESQLGWNKVEPYQ